MGIVAGIVGLGFLLIAGLVVYVIFEDAISSYQEDYAEKLAKQNDQSPPNVKTVGNLAKDTGTRVCNLKVEFVGSAYGQLLDNELYLGHGTFFKDQNLGLFGDFHDLAVVHYQWYCSDPGPEKASLLSFMGFYSDADNNKLREANVFEAGEDTVIRIFFNGESMNTGKKLVASKTPDGVVDQLEFSGIMDIPQGTKLPTAYTVPVYLYDVTEDNYRIEFWSKDFKMNSQNVNYHFSYNICKPGYTGPSCLDKVS